MTSRDPLRAGASLPDKVALGVLTRLITRELVEDVIASAGRKEKRERLLPARLVVYFVLALALFYGDPYEEVMRKLVQGLSWLAIWRRQWQVPTDSALAQARQRLGSGPLKELFERVAAPCAMRSTAGAWLRGRRLMSLDGVVLDTADTPANAEHFGYFNAKDGETGPFPKVLVVALAECGTHAITAVAAGQAGTGEHALAADLAGQAGSLQPGMLVMADRGLYSYDLCQAITAAGADFCIRAKVRTDLPALEWFPDGSYRSRITSAYHRRLAVNKIRRRPSAGPLDITALPGTDVRVVDYDIPGHGTSGEVITIITSITSYQEM